MGGSTAQPLVEENVSLSSRSTMRVGGSARHFVTVTETQQLRDVLEDCEQRKSSFFVLGGGSNVLFSDSGFDGTVIHLATKGTTVVDELNDGVRVDVATGESWDDFVREAVSREWWGVENLSAIPGTVGASPIQNIGAYGAEVADVIESVFVFDPVRKEVRTLSRDECRFGYRDSIFKRPEGRLLIVTAVRFSLSTKPRPNLSYADVKARFPEGETPTLQSIRDAIIAIRAPKFPDLSQYGTAGSFFKNPCITREHCSVLQEQFPELPKYETSDPLRVKVPLAWILDRVCGLRGARVGNVGLWESQPLVLVNYGGATSQEIALFAEHVASRVRETTEISIEWEVNRIASR